MKKHRWLKSIGLSVSIFAMVCGLAACGNKNSSSSSSSNSNEDGQPVTITFWDGFSGLYEKSMQKLVNEFNKSQTKYKVVCTSQTNYSNLSHKIMTAAKAHDLPVMAQSPYPSVPDYVKTGLIIPLNDYINKDFNNQDLNDIYPAFLKNTKYNGNYYSIPFSKSLDVLYYNKTLLKKYGLNLPTSWEEIQKDGKILKDKHANTKILQLNKSFDQEYQSMAKELGVNLISPGTLKPNYESNGSKEAANYFMNLLNNGYAATSSDNYGDSDWERGSAIFYADTSAGINFISQKVSPSFKWGTIPFPSYHGKKASVVAGTNLMIFKSASKKQRDGAWTFMKYLMSKPITLKWAEMTGYVPIRQSVAKGAQYQQYLKKHPQFKGPNDTLPYGFEPTVYPGNSQFYDQQLVIFSDMIDKKSTVNQALSQLQNLAKQIIDKNK